MSARPKFAFTAVTDDLGNPIGIRHEACGHENTELSAYVWAHITVALTGACEGCGKVGRIPLGMLAKRVH